MIYTVIGVSVLLFSDYGIAEDLTLFSWCEMCGEWMLVTVVCATALMFITVLASCAAHAFLASNYLPTLTYCSPNNLRLFFIILHANTCF